MKFQAKLIIAALGVATLPLAQAADFEDFGRVVRVEPRVEQVRTPRQEGRTEYVLVPVQQCRTVEAVESRTAGYNVTYEYRGQNYTSLMRNDPGNRVRLRVSVQPLDSYDDGQAYSQYQR